MNSRTTLLRSIILMILLFSIAAFVSADGGFFRPQPYFDEDLFEPTQKAIIIHDGESEKLIIQASYEGDIIDFAWVVPVPSIPEVGKISAYIFEELHYLTEPRYMSPPNGIFGGRGVMYATDINKQGVDIINQEQIGIYEVTTLTSEDPDAMLRWLNENNYFVSEDAKPVLQDYIDRKWYFVVTRINLAPIDEGLLESLKKIQPQITDKDDAREILVNYLADSIISKRDYYELNNIDTILDYGNDSEELIERDSYRYAWYIEYDGSGNPIGKPKNLISEESYLKLYEDYNGYLEEHMKDYIREKIDEQYEMYIRLPDRWECRDNEESVLCQPWYFGKDSKEYEVLKDSDCGKYCSLISPDKERYFIDDMVTVATYAIMQGDEKVMAYFKTSTDKEDWYDNKDDIENNVRGDVLGKLNSAATLKQNVLRQELSKRWAININRYLGQSGDSSYYANSGLTERVYSDIMYDEAYDNTAAHNAMVDDGYGASRFVIYPDEYERMKKLFNGDSDESALRSKIKERIDYILTWKTSMIQGKLGKGTLQPLVLDFASEEIIYPLKISSVNSGPSEILLYVFSRSKTEVSNYDGFELEFARWIEIEEIRTDLYKRYKDDISKNDIYEPKPYPNYYNYPAQAYIELNKLLDDRYFLTKYRDELWPKDMKEDMIFVPSQDNKSYRMKVYEKGYVLGWFMAILGLAFICLIIFGITAILRFLTNRVVKNKDSDYWMTWKRTIGYAAIIPLTFVTLWILEISSKRGGTDIRSLELVGEAIGKIGEPIMNFFNLIGFSDFLQSLITGIIVILIIFTLLHVTVSLLFFALSKKMQAAEDKEIPKRWFGWKNIGITALVMFLSSLFILILLALIATGRIEGVYDSIRLSAIFTMIIIVPLTIWKVFLLSLTKLKT